MKSDVLKFISRFTSGGKVAAVEECFTHDCCYWFAHILKRRFYGTIVFDRDINHFGCRILEHVYDITGDVTESYNWEEWDLLFVKNKPLYEKIVRDYVEF